MLMMEQIRRWAAKLQYNLICSVGSSITEDGDAAWRLLTEAEGNFYLSPIASPMVGMIRPITPAGKRAFLSIPDLHQVDCAGIKNAQLVRSYPGDNLVVSPLRVEGTGATDAKSISAGHRARVYGYHGYVYASAAFNPTGGKLLTLTVGTDTVFEVKVVNFASEEMIPFNHTFAVPIDGADGDDITLTAPDFDAGSFAASINVDYHDVMGGVIPG